MECSHLGLVKVSQPRTMGGETGCEECLKMGDTWVHLRLCRTCGHVGCCDESKNKHATKRSEEHTSELQSPDHLVCRLLLEKKKYTNATPYRTKRNVPTAQDGWLVDRFVG